MKTEQPVQPFDIFLFEVDHWDNPSHQHNFFELLCIQAGSVQQSINNNTREYQKGQLPGRARLVCANPSEVLLREVQ